jgi:hypothetical protein
MIVQDFCYKIGGMLNELQELVSHGDVVRVAHWQTRQIIMACDVAT